MGNVNQEQRRVLVLAESEGRKTASVTFELLGVGEKLSQNLNKILCAVVIGHEVTDQTQEIVHFANEVYSIDDIDFERFQPELYTNALDQLLKNITPDIIIMGHTLNNLDLAPRLAFKLRSHLIMDCTDITIEGDTGNLLCSKPVYGGNAIAVFRLKNKPCIIAVRPKAIKPIEQDSVQGAVIHFHPEINKGANKVDLVEIKREESISLDKADAIVAGGRGIKKREGLKYLDDLIEILRRHFRKVELGGSRPLVDMGFIPPSRQIGLTGEKVAPGLYVAVGISGAIQHLTGILGSKKIIAINRDSEAQIFRSADYGVIDSYEDVLPAFRKKLEELL